MLEKDALPWVYATGEESSSHVQDTLPKDGGVLGDGDRVEVNNAIQHSVTFIL